jgi:hypothetical protein
MKPQMNKQLNIIWAITEQEYGYTNLPIREPMHTNQRYSFWIIARQTLPNVAFARIGEFTGLKNGKRKPYDHASVINGIRAAKLNYDRPDEQSIEFVFMTGRILKKVHELLGDKPIYTDKTRKRYKKGVEWVKTSFKKLRILESKLNQATDPTEIEKIKWEIETIQKRKRGNYNGTIHQPKYSARHESVRL